MSKCENCPLKDHPAECFAITSGHARFCDLAVNQCHYRQLIWEKSTSDPCPIECETYPVEVAPPPPPPAIIQPQQVDRIMVPWDWLTGDQQKKYESFKGCGCGGRRVPIEIHDLNPAQRKRLKGIYTKAQLKQFGV